MKLDKTQIIGYILMLLLFLAFFYYNTSEQQQYQNTQKKQTDSLQAHKAKEKKQLQETTQENKPFLSETQQEILDTVVTPLYAVILSNKGANIQSFQLHHYHQSGSKNPVQLIANNWSLSYLIHYDKTLESKEIPFSRPEKEINGDTTRLTYTLNGAQGERLYQTYTFVKNDYKVDVRIRTENGAENWLDKSALRGLWQYRPIHQEKNYAQEKTQSEVAYMQEKEGFDYNKSNETIRESYKMPLLWLSNKQQFFNAALIASAQNPMEAVHTESVPDTDSSRFIFNNQTSFQLSPNSDKDYIFSFYLGPNDYSILEKYNLGLHKMINLGRGAYAFAKYINIGLVLPIFHFLEHFVSNYGLLILFLTLIIRLITVPLMYSGYKASAKMRLLQPEIKELEKKYGDNPQQLNLKRMELYQSSGASPLQGCLPMLLQLPIFIALYSFFYDNISLREQPFLWSSDLSAYDSILDLPFYIPIYGDHISLFAILNTLTSVGTIFLNKNTSMDNNNPAIKYMPYIMPFFFFFFFNSFPAALTWYYTVSNVFSIILQVLIQKFILNHDKLLAQIERNKKTKKKKSAWLIKMEEIQEQQRKIKQIKK